MKDYEILEKIEECFRREDEKLWNYLGVNISLRNHFIRRKHICNGILVGGIHFYRSRSENPVLNRGIGCVS